MVRLVGAETRVSRLSAFFRGGFGAESRVFLLLASREGLEWLVLRLRVGYFDSQPFFEVVLALRVAFSYSQLLGKV
ncbi:hypothetical protein SAMN05518855_100429 [Paenibacillus sp. CF384]|nr:hypothetical protein SAMN05518855_100429 [Paenibacillus sp. CF384]